MGSPFLSDFIENALGDLETYVPAADRRELDFKNLLQLCYRYRQRGVCSFLLDGDPQPLFFSFMQSAGAYAECLPHIAESEKLTSQSKPFYDAVGGRFWDCAEKIAKASRTTWNKPKEYEDDFLFVLFLMKRFFLGASQGECRSVIDAHEVAAEGKDQAHRDVCSAFMSADAPMLDSAIRQLLAERAQRVEGMIERGAMPEESWAWLRYFSSEGLALVRLADREGLAIGTDFLHVSERLRKSPTFAFDPGAWRWIHRSGPATNS